MNPIWTGNFFPVNLGTALSCQLQSQLCHFVCETLSLTNANEKTCAILGSLFGL